MNAYTKTDVLIIGSGLAGAYAALEVLTAGSARVTLATAHRPGQGNSAWAQGGVAAAVHPEDTPALHAADTMVAGAGYCHPEAVAVLTQEGPAHVRRLAELGVPFAPDLGLEGGHSRRRVLHTPGSRTGREIMAVLTRQLAQAAGDRLRILDHTELLALDSDGGRCRGGWFRRGAPAAGVPPGADRIHVAAAATLLATGGSAGLFRVTTNPPTALGAGIAAAYQAGAAVADMEFVQFHPTALPRSDGGCTLISEAVRGEGAHLLNARGERFMLPLHPLAELAPRDVVARAIIAESERLGAPVCLSLRHLPAAAVHAAFPFLSRVCREEGLDLARDLLPVIPAAHYLCGGVWTDLEGRSTVPGLWAAGEAACTGVHGANRLASNSLLECLVFGARAARSIASAPAAGRDCAPGADAPPDPPSADLQALRAAVGRLLGPVRNRTGLKELLEWLSAQPETPAHLCAGLMARGALMRSQSTGSHYRSDAVPAGGQAYRIIQRRGEPVLCVPLTAVPEPSGLLSQPV